MVVNSRRLEKAHDPSISLDSVSALVSLHPGLLWTVLMVPACLKTCSRLGLKTTWIYTRQVGLFHKIDVRNADPCAFSLS